MANKLEDLVRVATVLTRWLVTLFIWSKRQRELQQTKTFEVFEALFYLRAFEALFLFECLWSLWRSLFIQEFLRSLKLFCFESVFEVFEALFYLKAMPNSQIKQSFKGVTIATSRNKENFQRLVLPTSKKQREFSTILPCSPFKTKTSFKACHGDHAKANGVGSSWKGRVIGLV